MPAIDPFASAPAGTSSPAYNAAAVTPHDSNELEYVARALYIGGAGNIVVVTKGGQTVTFTGVTAGTILPVSVKQVLSTSTTATSIVALW